MGVGLTVSAFGNHAMLYKQLVYQHQGLWLSWLQDGLTVDWKVV